MAPSKEKRLWAWHQKLSPLLVDLVGDFAGKELFAIHGDSLLLHCLTEAGVDFTDGFQLLHAVHAVESVLCSLKQRGCNFHIIWFRAHEHLCVPRDDAGDGESSCRRLARAIVIKHLEHHARVSLKQALVFQFDDADCDDFRQYLAQNAVHCFLCLDGGAVDGLGASAALQYLEFAHRMTVRGYSIALINSLKFVSSKILVSVCSASPRREEIGIKDARPRPRASTKTISDLEPDMGLQPGDWSPWEDGEALSVRDTISLTGLCNVLLANPHESFKACAAAYIIHLSVLRRCSLAQRSCKVAVLDAQDEQSLDDFLASFGDICLTVVESMPVQAKWDAFDLLDGRILRQIFEKLTSLAPPLIVVEESRRFAKRIFQLTQVDVSDLIPVSPVSGEVETRAQTPNTSRDRPNQSVLPFSHPVLDEFLEPIRLQADGAAMPVANAKVFEDLTHWHTAKVSLNSRFEAQKRMGFFALRRNQQQMAQMMEYSASLTNASGKSLKPETIVTVPSTTSAKVGKQGAPKTATHAPRGKGKKQPPKSGRESARAEVERIQEEKNTKRLGAVVAFWEERCREFQAEGNLVKRFLKAEKYLASMSKEDAALIGAEVSLYTCNVLASLILDGKRRGAGASEMSLFAMIWSRILTIRGLRLSSQSLSHLETFSTALHMPLPDTMARNVIHDKRKLPFRNVLAASSTAASLSLEPIEFQLRHCGPYLERSFDPADDARVPNFRPDAWQRKVLDAIDADKSLFVVAPTSAGKTFISFYAMKKLLQSSDDGILVYVAPTKALVNQIAAEIQARFSKSYANSGRSVWAIHTRDYRIHNPTGCQVLVTVPHMLQIMLLTPTNAEKTTSWARRVRRIIFDEVHCIGQAEEGIVWEQLLLLAPCPIIALSATVGNPGELKDWLEASERAKGVELEMIVHSSRYSDLRKFTYTPPKKSYIFRGLPAVERLEFLGLDEGDGGPSPFSFIHPVMGLVNRNRGTLQDIHLEPRDCFSLWRCMSKHQTKTHPVDDSLGPSNFLPTVVTRPDVVRWECALKKCLESWMQDPQSPFSAVRAELGEAFYKSSSVSRNETSHDEASPNSSSFGVEFKVEEHAVQSMALPLAVDLRRRGALPAILFNYNRDVCETTLHRLQKQLAEAEGAWKASSPEWKKKVAAYEEWKKTQSQADRYKKDKAIRPTKGRSGDEAELSKLDAIRESSSVPSKWESFDPEAPLDLFSFANRATLLDSELESLMGSLRWARTDARIVSALRRGIAVHHAGMNRGYRQVVEMLFRKGFLTVVIATGTLALGLNMPCKTVVFLGDSIFLTTLNYLQAAGRAGRRGFDLLGNVVFAGMPPERALDIMSSRLPDLRGQFPLSTTLVLRLLGLLHHTDNSEYAARAMRSLLSQTRLYMGGPSDQMAIQHHLRFSIEYLGRQHLLSADGAPLNFSGLVGHLYFTENAVFAFHSLLKDGYFHHVCAAIYRNPEAVLLQLMLVLAHLFCRVPVYGRRAKVMARSPSVVLLPSLPEKAETILRKHNRETLEIFKTYVSTYVEQHLVESPDTRLPLTGHDMTPQQQDGHSAANMLDTLPATRLRSPFAALSGFTDEFETIHELCDTVRSGVFLEESAVPYIRIFPQDTAGVPWNAYVYDFFKHGDLTALVRDNGIKRGDVWFHLKDFSLILATIVTSLTNFLRGSAGDDCMMDVRDVDDVIEEDRDELCSPAPAAAGNDGGPAAVPAAATHEARKKKVVVDSWEDESSDDGGSEKDEECSSASSASQPRRSAAVLPGNGDESLLHVLVAFEKLQHEFDEKFRKVWA